MLDASTRIDVLNLLGDLKRRGSRDPVHHPRPGARQLHQRPDGDPPARPDRRDGHDPQGLRRAAPSIHAEPARLGPAGPPTPGVTWRPSSAMSRRRPSSTAASITRRHAESGRPARRRRHRAAARADRGRPSRRLRPHRRAGRLPRGAQGRCGRGLTAVSAAGGSAAAACRPRARTCDTSAMTSPSDRRRADGRPRTLRGRHRHRGPLPAPDREQDVLWLLDGLRRGRRRTATSVRSASACRAPSRRSIARPSSTYSRPGIADRCDDPRDDPLGSQELLLPGPAEGLPDQPVRPAARVDRTARRSGRPRAR